jgi:glycine oxidase
VSATGSDVLVVGGGVIGLCAGWRLARDGAVVRLLDDSGSRGASWTAAGMLAPVSEAAYGEEDLLRLNLAALARFPEVAAEIEADTGHGVGLRRTGTLLVARDADDGVALRRLAAFCDSLGLPTETLTVAERRRQEPALSPAVRGAILVPDDLSVDNRCYVRALVAAQAKVGVDVVIEAARGLLRAGRRVVGVRTAQREFCADHVVLAAGSRTAELDGLPRELDLPIRPVKGQILRLRPEPTARRTVPPIRRTIRALVHGAEVYLVPRDSGEVVVGATVEERGGDRSVTVGAVHDLLRDACEVVPGLRELVLAECQAGSRPGTPDNGPVVGPSGTPGLIVATGHHRNGILLSALTADAVLAAVRGRSLAPEWLAFPPRRFTQGVL